MTQIFDDTICQLGEGPSFDPALNLLWWFDIEGKRYFEHDFGSGETKSKPHSKMASMAGIVDDNTMLMAFQDGLYLRNRTTGELQLHHPLEADNQVTRSNDGRVHPSGALWIGTMGIQGEENAGSIYWFYKGELRCLFENITVPNAICFSPDGRTAYFTDTPTKKMMRLDVDPMTGFPTGEAEVFFDHTDNKGFQDGAVCDADGNIWNACWRAANVIKISPDGQLLETFPVPALQPTCPAFVGSQLDRLIITSATSSMSSLRMEEYPDSGKTFLLDIPVRGKAEPRIIL